MFTKSTEYAIRSVIYLAVHASSDKLIGTIDIARELNFPVAFLGKVLQNLVKKEIIVSVKGPGGGFYINKKTNNYSILTIVDKLEGLDFLNKCGLGLYDCCENGPCPIHDEYEPIKRKIESALASKTISKIKQDIEANEYAMNFNIYDTTAK